MAVALDTLARRRGAHLVAVYAATAHEADPAAFARRWRAGGGALAWPRVVGQRIVFHRISGPQALIPGYRGILEPPPSAAPVAPRAIDLLVVPGIGFDDRGWRLGQGGGFYDRLLATLPRLYSVGLGYTCQLVDDLPHEAHDARLDALVIEARLIEMVPSPS